MPSLLRDPHDRERLLTLLDRVLADKRVQRIQPTAEQSAMLARIRGVLASANAPERAKRRGNGSVKAANARKRVARNANAAPAGH